ncbi:ParB/RepB/Spo0J family partition protein [Phaeovulum vinaykumarii]|uniref:Chromosome segregation DNA-binding protein n=1 Tax=Phaeovulum vinaykumarii TaxID=407234 RepID=A0A1N7MAJ6_9RHOB|nr:ParB/RepB/Spo0J family partition protein [Phaeovulum vinaykumarii]SIS83145.1 chromosome segregation DNA-binding protein [Phaeovulum vinaykumarii]SOC10408.1 chromosome segregation DNA-binding protein [Phaeovulum vinaykumarii]
MSSRNERRGLGRGLSALMADVNLSSAAPAESAPRKGDIAQIPIEKIEANPTQPRRVFAPEALEELAQSLREKGIIQPLILRPNPRDPQGYEIVAGERRWRAAQLARIDVVPAIVRELDDTETLEVAIIENIQRADLSAIEEAMAYRQLMDKFGHTQEKIAEALSKSRSHIANLLRLLTLPDSVQDMVRRGDLSAGHARALINAPDPDALARRILSSGMSVREAERMATEIKGTGRGPSEKRQAPRRDKDADTLALEADLTATLKMPVSIDHVGAGGGSVTISYRDLEELDALCQRLSGIC